MEYSVLAVGLSDKLFSNLKKLVVQYKLHFVSSPSIQDANRLVCHQMFHLIIVDLEFLRISQQVAWLAGIRRNTFAPIIVLSELPEKDTNRMIQVGADICSQLSDRQITPGHLIKAGMYGNLVEGRVIALRVGFQIFGQFLRRFLIKGALMKIRDIVELFPDIK